MSYKKRRVFFRLVDAIRETIHNGDLSIEELAERIGSSANYLYRWCLEGESGANMPLAKVSPLMQAAGDFAILATLARINGFLLVREPRGTLDKKRQSRAMSDWHKDFSSAMSLLVNYFEHPSESLKAELVAALQIHLERTAKLKRFVSVDKGQHDFFEGN